MAWTYDITTSRGKVRFLIQDTNTNIQLLTDAEVDFALSQSTNLYRAAAIAARAIALNFTRKPTLDPAPGGTSLNPQEQADKYLKLAEELEDQASGSAAGVGAAVFAGGISDADKTTREQDSDRTQPAFTRDMQTETTLEDWASLRS